MNDTPADPQTSLQLERILPVPPGRVFEAWTMPEAIKFWFAGAGTVIDEVQVDLRVGGRYTIRYQDASGGETVVTGKYLQIEPPRRLVFSWTMKSGQLIVDENIVTVEFRDLGNRTQVQLTHEPFPDPEIRRLHAQGWDVCLTALGQFLDAGLIIE
ncbi:MAG: SRPBCC family protein [Chloroflexota bacterium]